jgi:phosphatidylserine decarboxylase
VQEPHPLIAREGWPHVAIAVGLALLATAFLGGWALLFWGLAVFVVQFFRDPPRGVPLQPGVAVSPADGRVLLVQKARDPYLNREALKISVFMNVFNVHSNRSPVDGVVKERWYHGGKYLNASLDKSSNENERLALWIHMEDGTEVTCVQVAGLVARRRPDPERRGDLCGTPRHRSDGTSGRDAGCLRGGCRLRHRAGCSDREDRRVFQPEPYCRP